MSRRLPDCLVVTIRAGRTPVSGALVMVSIGTNRKNPFNSLHGPSGPDGRLTITREALLQSAEQTRNLSLMDYTHPEEDGSGNLLLEPLSKEGTDRALSAFNRLRRAIDYGPAYRENLEAWRIQLQRFEGVAIVPEVDVAGGEVAVVTRTLTEPVQPTRACGPRG